MKNRIDKDLLLKATNGGLDVFRILIPDKLEEAEKGRFKNVRNPCYNDKNPSMSIYLNEEGDKYLFHDHGDDSYSGDIFDFVAHYNGLDVKQDFQEILEIIVDICEIERESVEVKKKYVKRFKSDDQAITQAKKDGLQFFAQYKIFAPTLQEYCVSFDKYLPTQEEWLIHGDKITTFKIVYNGEWFKKYYLPPPTKRF